MDYQQIEYEVKNKVAHITLNRPDSLNSMTFTMKKELARAVETIENDRDIWGVIITGAGRAFSTGTEISEFPDTVEGARTIADYAQKLFTRIENLNKPVIAAVNGFAVGGGFELALACDLRVVSTKAKFGFSEVKIGAIPCYGGSQRLVRQIGPSIAKELIFTGRMLDAPEAKTLRLANVVCEPSELMQQAESLMASILANAPMAVSYAKICINRGAEISQDYAMQLEQDLVGMLVPTHDLAEGTAAFFEKRAPKFENR